MSDKLDKTVQKLVDIVQAKKAQIKKLVKPSYNTNNSFAYFEDGYRVNLLVIDKLKLLKILAWLTTEYSVFTTLCSDMGIKCDYKHMGFKFSDWESDVKTRINIIDIKALKADLKKKEEQLEELLSPEQIRALKIERLAKEIED